MDEPRSPSDKSVPAEAEAARDRLGRGLGRIWIGVLVAAAILLAVLVWLVA
ncbi:MAG: hypothetical protein ICV64_00365 [Thermoleophilia bacterium]|nr:hypothetical protein [Thermoleophilia bacterium]